MSIMLCWAAALLCLQGCCEKVCGRCESSVWKECRHCYPQEPLQNCCRWLLSPPCTGGTLLDGNTGLCSTGRDLLIPGETPLWRVTAAPVTWKGHTGVLGKGRGIGLSIGLALHTAICSGLCSSNITHSFFHQLKIPVD